jgi:acetoin utilization deacetylase AcuC-like enzyme
MERLTSTGLAARLQSIGMRSATDAELELAHTAAHVERIRRLDEIGGGAIDPDTAVVPGSLEAAVHATGGVLGGVDLVLRGDAPSAFCLVRPPGHHACADRAMGFCYFNSVAVAARYASREHGIERLAIVDFDVHHGNGSQEIFWDDPSVLYLSTHQFPFYPGSGNGREIGGPAAEGSTVNVPLPAGCGDAEYLRCFDRILLPQLERFQPQLLLLSAGYDAHSGDPLAGMAVSTEGYRGIVTRLRQAAEAVCAGRIVAALEGGYDLDDLAASVEASIEALLEPAPSFTPAQPASEQFEAYLDQLRALHRLT